MCLDFYEAASPPSLSQISLKRLFVTSLQNVILKFTISELDRLRGWLKRCEGEELGAGCESMLGFSSNHREAKRRSILRVPLEFESVPE